MLMGAQGLLDDPHRPATLARLEKTFDQLGFVQVDSICTIARAHDLTLAARYFDYRPAMLKTLLEKKRVLFENWTHDASIIPAKWYPQWKHRFAGVNMRIATSGWWQKRFGDRPEKTLAEVEARIRNEGEVRSRDFESPRTDVEKGWWGWTTTKAALELLWRSGMLVISRRENFQKVYDLAERIYPEHHAAPKPEWSAHVDWACRTALERLGFATARELAHYWASIPLAEARTWSKAQLASGELVAIDKTTFAFHDWKKRASKLGGAPEVMRFLAPFDPVIRDRARALRLFGYDYTFEAFTPAPKRIYGYYVLPILDGDRFIGRIDPKLHRDKDQIEVRGVWWEPKVRETKKLKDRLDETLERLAAFTGVKTIVRGK